MNKNDDVNMLAIESRLACIVEGIGSNKVTITGPNEDDLTKDVSMTLFCDELNEEILVDIDGDKQTIKAENDDLREKFEFTYNSIIDQIKEQTELIYKKENDKYFKIG